MHEHKVGAAAKARAVLRRAVGTSRQRKAHANWRRAALQAEALVEVVRVWLALGRQVSKGWPEQYALSSHASACGAAQPSECQAAAVHELSLCSQLYRQTERLARRLPGVRGPCLIACLATLRCLRRRRIRTFAVAFGMVPSHFVSGQPCFHAWLEHGGTPVLPLEAPVQRIGLCIKP